MEDALAYETRKRMGGGRACDCGMWNFGTVMRLNQTGKHGKDTDGKGCLGTQGRYLSKYGF